MTKMTPDTLKEHLGFDGDCAECKRHITAWASDLKTKAELLEVVHILVAHVDGFSGERGTNSPMMLRARAAIAVAEAKP